MKPGDLAEETIAELKRRIPYGPLVWAINALESAIKDSILAAVKTVTVQAPGIVIEDESEGRGAIIEDLR